jgi:hypothetical protein
VTIGPELLLVATVIAVGVLHTLVPDHWAPIALLARSAHWSRTQTARAAAIAGLGHTVSTIAIGVVVWLAGTALAVRFGTLLSTLSSVALVAFGLWIAVASWLEVRKGETHDRVRSEPNKRTALLFILGSSPMVEGIPAFFAASKFGAGLLLVMAACFAASTIGAYVALCVYAQTAFERLSLGTFERYAEVLSGVTVAVVGVVFFIWPLA